MKALFLKRWFLWSIYSLAALLISVQRLGLGVDAKGYTAYENYRIFRNAFFHLLNGHNPYASFPAEQWDLFKYSPAFALMMAPFAALPDWAGLPLWNLLNALLLLAAIWQMQVLTEKQRVFMAWWILPELVVSMQNSQSNGLTAALILWTFVALERAKPGAAAGWTAAGAFLKIFGIFSALLAWFYPQKLRFALSLAAWMVFFALVPMVVLGPQHLAQVYEWWWELLRSDHASSVGLSVQGWLQTWFGWSPPKMAVTGTGLLILLISTFYARRLPQGALLTLASILLWVVIFNHKAESPTFVIAMCGVAIWYVTSGRSRWETALLVVTFILVSLSPTDIFPRLWREQIVQPFVLKSVPCIAVWVLLTIRMMRPTSGY
ncbi:MAG TPA: glycosyltransferase family 87 protein [Saprospiraceae bacterium]|nr:glycosyltransferase family 87 protein [Saprospiraceae bacterium]HPI08021.1 glycosyltransferase family 87 protein [Saprospiraceae bacterium]